MEIFKEFAFDSAHRLPNVPPGHKCGRLHGHTFNVALHVRGPVGVASGWGPAGVRLERSSCLSRPQTQQSPRNSPSHREEKARPYVIVRSPSCTST